MKKRILTLALALMMCLALVPMTALAAVEAPTISNLAIYYTDGNLSAGLEFDIIVPDSAKSLDGFFLVDEVSLDGGEWEGLGFDGDNRENGTRRTYPTTLNADTVVKYRVRYQYRVGDDYNFSPWSNVLTLNEKIDIGNTSDWAKTEIEKADALGLIPDSLKGADLTKPITRAEFAAVSVKVYENLAATKAIPAVNNPFTDTKDVEVLKAYNVGVTSGTAADKFSPDVLLNREQAATMLTRVFKKVSLAGWTLADDAKFTLPYTKPAAFADDKDISDYAKDSVYFMAANGIIGGTGNNNFSPKAVTDAQKAQGYANATREQALAIAVRMVEKLAGKEVAVIPNTQAGEQSQAGASNGNNEAVKKIPAGETRNIKFGNYDWRVLEVSGDKALIITEDIVKQEQPYQDALKISAKDETTHFFWAYSLVRAYCNGEFLNTFTAEEQALIIPTELVMEPNPVNGQESGPSTTDKIWCLSVSEAQKYFTYETAYARNHTNNKTELWWLRTTGSSFITACVAPHVLSTDSEIGKYGGTNSVDKIGVRPAMWISLI